MFSSNKIGTLFVLINSVACLSQAMHNSSLPQVTEVLGTNDVFFLKNFGPTKVLNPSKNLMVVGLGHEIHVVYAVGCSHHKKHETLLSFVAYKKDLIQDVKFSPSGNKLIATRVFQKGRFLLEIKDHLVRPSGIS